MKMEYYISTLQGIEERKEDPGHPLQWHLQDKLGIARYLRQLLLEENERLERLGRSFSPYTTVYQIILNRLCDIRDEIEQLEAEISGVYE